MSFIKAMEYRAVAYFLVKVLDEKRIKEVANRVGQEIDELLDRRYKEKRSEKLQAKLIRVINQFANCLIVKLKEDWKEVDYGKKKK